MLNGLSIVRLVLYVFCIVLLQAGHLLFWILVLTLQNKVQKRPQKIFLPLQMTSQGKFDGKISAHDA